MKILNKLTIKHLALNKKRTVTTIIGILLSTALMVGIGLIFSSIREVGIKTSILVNGRYMAKYNDISSDKLSVLNLDKNVEDYYYYRHLGSSKLEKIVNPDKTHLEVLEVDKNFFNELELIEGTIPKNSNELLISSSLIKVGDYDLKVGDKLTLNFEDTEALDNSETEVKEYKIVGIVKKYVTEDYYNPSYQAYTLGNFDDKDVTVLINFKNPKDTYKLGLNLGLKLGITDIHDIRYNDSLIIWYGASMFDNVMNTFINIFIIILTLISIGCIMVIYNSFAISVMERKKQFGLYASIGATKKQLKHTVFFEALIVGGIGIILGIISSYIGIGIVISIVNQLLPDIFGVPLTLSTYPLFIIIPIIFMILVIICSAYLPAKRASKLSPISIIKQNDDIKIKSKNIKTRKFIHKIFGIEGEIALKNIKRNKKKYRITIVSLFISVVLFISFSSILKYVVESTTKYAFVPSYNLEISMVSPDDSFEDDLEILKKLKNHYQVEKSLIINNDDHYIMSVENSSSLTKEYLKLGSYRYENLHVVWVSDEEYEELLKKYNAKDGTSFFINKYYRVSYNNNTRKVYEGKLFNDNFDGFYVLNQLDENHTNKLENITLIDEVPFGIEKYVYDYCYNTIIVNAEVARQLYEWTYAKYDEKNGVIRNKILKMYIASKNYDELKLVLDDLKNNTVDFDYKDIDQEFRLIKNGILTIKILLYGFISLVTLIGITGVFNTINTSINLRRKEFAMLRSIGLSPKGFNKMLYFESIFFGIKTLLYSIPVSIGVSYLIFNSINKMIEFNFKVPYEPIFISCISVFIIVLITMMYSSQKIKKENILDTIRQENI